MVSNAPREGTVERTEVRKAVEEGMSAATCNAKERVMGKRSKRREQERERRK